MSSIQTALQPPAQSNSWSRGYDRPNRSAHQPPIERHGGAHSMGWTRKAQCGHPMHRGSGADNDGSAPQVRRRPSYTPAPPAGDAPPRRAVAVPVPVPASPWPGRAPTLQSQTPSVAGDQRLVPLHARPSLPPQPGPLSYPSRGSSAPKTATTLDLSTTLTRIGGGAGMASKGVDLYFATKHAIGERGTPGAAHRLLAVASAVTGVGASAAGLADTFGVRGADTVARGLGAVALSLAVFKLGLKAVPGFEGRDNTDRSLEP